MMVIQTNLFKEIGDFFSDILSTEYWPARWHCGKWTDFHGWLYIISDLMIWAAYFAIPFLLFRLVTRRKDLPFSKVFWLFIAFILLCGMTHLIDAVIFWLPMYRLSAVIQLFAGIVSLSTVYALYRILPQVYSLRTAEQLEAEIIQRKRAEEEARFQLLEHQKTRELLKVKDDFINMASHELKTPLTSLKGYLHIIQKLAGANDPNQLEFILKANNQASKLTDLVNTLFNVSRMQMGLYTLEKTTFPIKKLIYECAESFEVLGKQLEIRISDDSLTVEADREKLRQVLVNLIDNAFKYSPGQPLVELCVTKEEGFVQIYVRDFGIGIESEKIPYIFERYYRIDPTTHYLSGMGLGLYICKQIVQQHGGDIGVESIPMKGSTFWIKLPSF